MRNASLELLLAITQYFSVQLSAVIADAEARPIVEPGGGTERA